MTIAFNPAEIKSVADLREKYPALPAEFDGQLLDCFASIRALFVRAADTSIEDVFQGQLALMGLAQRTYELFLGMVQQLSWGNGHVWSACFRGLVETFGAAVYVNEKPASLVALLDRGISAGKLRAAAERGSPGLAGDLDRLNAIVHPGDRSVYAAARVADVDAREAFIRLGVEDFAADDVAEGAEVTRNICILIVNRFNELLDAHPELLRAGRPIAKRQKNGGR